MKTWPIFIPSKGRAESIKTVETLGVDVIPYLVVEPQELAAYQKKLGQRVVYLTLPAAGQGIAYVRNFILEWAQGAGYSWYWMMDDDVSGFYQSRGGKNHRTEALTVLHEAQRLLREVPNLGQAALEYQQFSWSAKTALAINTYCDVCVAIHAERVGPLRYRPELNLKEDRDFTLQVLSSGLNTARTRMLAFSAPKNGSNNGGLKDLYDQSGREAIASARMAQAWPGVCEPVTKSDGRQDVKIHWWKFKRAY